MKNLIPVETIQGRILLIRNEKVILDRDLAELYGIETRVLKQQVRRNLDRFPIDFMFEMAEDEIEILVSQNVIPSKSTLGGAKPMAFTEQGVAMLSSVLRSPGAVQVNIAIMRAFVQMRKILSTHKELKGKIEAMEKKYDKNFRVVFAAIKELMEPIPPKKEIKIGFRIPEKVK
ncbi:MAG: ORF6N domain-containing protein [Candidatus Marinimicrobia bacterium]|nr:ORF6N domain-containing protein [Candidatus Neomarinimicrobiota bacterium]